MLQQQSSFTPEKQFQQQTFNSILPETANRSSQLVFNTKKDIFKRYKKEKPLGSGSYGQVFKVTQIVSGQSRALKVLDKKHTDVPIKGLIDEVNNVRKLDHPNVLKVYEVAEDETNIYIISELCDGQELFTEIFNRIDQNKPFTERQVQQITRQLMSAIAYAHKHNIIHRDIKPENILIETEKNDDLQVLLIDWGLSKDISMIKQIKQKIGTVDYAAPEVLRGLPYDGRCDVWSCGVILYILLSGETPFPGRNTGEIEKTILQSKYGFKKALWKSVSPDAIDLIKQMIEPDQNKRATAQNILDHVWLKSPEQNNFLLPDNSKKRLKQFCCQNKLLQATLHFMVAQVLNKENQNELRSAFKIMDKDGDGRLSLQEFSEGMINEAMDDNQIKEVFDRIDSDKTGFIYYTQFLAAGGNLKNIARKDKIKEVFDHLDQDGKGYIEVTELKEILAPTDEQVDDGIWDLIVSGIDMDGNGRISFEDYKQTIHSFVQQIGTSALSSQEDFDLKKFGGSAFCSQEDYNEPFQFNNIEQLEQLEAPIVEHLLPIKEVEDDIVESPLKKKVKKNTPTKVKVQAQVQDTKPQYNLRSRKN